MVDKKLLAYICNRFDSYQIYKADYIIVDFYGVYYAVDTENLKTYSSNGFSKDFSDVLEYAMANVREDGTILLQYSRYPLSRTVKAVKNVTIDGQGSTIVASRNIPFIEADIKPMNIRIKNLTLKYGKARYEYRSKEFNIQK